MSRKHVCIFNRKCWCGAGPKSRSHTSKAAWPIESDAAGVHPSQVPAALEEAKRLGTHVEFKKNGCAVFQSLEHQREYSRKIGLVDRSRLITMPKVRTMRERSI